MRVLNLNICMGTCAVYLATISAVQSYIYETRIYGRVSSTEIRNK